MLSGNCKNGKYPVGGVLLGPRRKFRPPVMLTARACPVLPSRCKVFDRGPKKILSFEHRIWETLQKRFASTSRNSIRRRNGSFSLGKNYMWAFSSSGSGVDPSMGTKQGGGHGSAPRNRPHQRRSYSQNQRHVAQATAREDGAPATSSISVSIPTHSHHLFAGCCCCRRRRPPRCALC